MSVSKETKHAVLEAADFCCHYCSGKATTVDHKIPQAAGGSDARSNLLPACEPCNVAKSTMSYDLYVRFTRRFGRPERAQSWQKRTNWFTDRSISKILSNVDLARAFEIVMEKYSGLDPVIASNKIRRASTAHAIKIDKDDLAYICQQKLDSERAFKW